MSENTFETKTERATELNDEALEATNGGVIRTPNGTQAPSQNLAGPRRRSMHDIIVSS